MISSTNFKEQKKNLEPKLYQQASKNLKKRDYTGRGDHTLYAMGRFRLAENALSGAIWPRQGCTVASGDSGSG